MSKKSTKRPLGTPTSSSAGVQRAGEDTGVPRKIIPRLRFPEFRDAGAWKACNLRQVLLEISNGLSLEQSNDLTGYRVTRIETISGDAIDIEKVGYVKKEQDISRYRLNVGDILFSNINSVSHIGRSVIVDQDYDLYHGMNLLRLVVESENNDARFLYYLLNTEEIRHSIKSRANKAVNQASINQTELGRTPIIVPKKNEQQKNADCLSSLDGLIAAQSEKLDALKTHKKGLMQRLFPRVGETVPGLRFPEFRDAGVWEEKELGDLCKIQTGRKDANEGAEDGEYPFFTCAAKHISSKNYSFDAEAILVAGNANVGQTTYYKGKFEAYQRTYVLTDFTDVDVAYLYSILSADLRNALLSQVQSSAMSYIKLPMLKEYALSIPPSRAEQQKIADCLSSLDGLIAAQSEKIDALKTHKKGLMQQLFPAVEKS